MEFKKQLVYNTTELFFTYFTNTLCNKNVDMFFTKKVSKKLTSFFLRKNKTFLKSKYTRTRQWSKSIVYFGLWFNLGSIYFSFLYTYQWYINISAYWWLFYGLLLSFVFRAYLTSFIWKKRYPWFTLYIQAWSYASLTPNRLYGAYKWHLIEVIEEFLFLHETAWEGLEEPADDLWIFDAKHRLVIKK